MVIGYGVQKKEDATGAVTAVDSKEFKDGNFIVQLLIDKKPKEVIVNITIDGSFSTICDRCLADISLPIHGEQLYSFKYVDENEFEDQDDETIILNKNVTEIDFTPHIFETIYLAVPLIKVYNCQDDEESNCDQGTLKYLEFEENEQEENPIWDILKNINN